MSNATTYTTRSYISASGNRITVHRPVLTDAERAKRMAVIKEAAARLLLAIEREKQAKRPK